MKKFDEFVNESALNEGAGTIALGVAGAIIGIKLFKGLLVFTGAVAAGLMSNKLAKKFDGIKERMAAILAKYPESIQNNRVFRDFNDGDLESVFGDENGMGRIGMMQSALSMDTWEKEDSDEFMDLYAKAMDIWNVLLDSSKNSIIENVK